MATGMVPACINCRGTIVVTLKDICQDCGRDWSRYGPLAIYSWDVVVRNRRRHGSMTVYDFAPGFAKKYPHTPQHARAKKNWFSRWRRR